MRRSMRSWRRSRPIRSPSSCGLGVDPVIGLERVREPHVKHLEGPLWEIRMKGRDGISRALYVVARPKRVVVVRVFAKKTQKTPRHEIELALKRAEDVT